MAILIKSERTWAGEKSIDEWLIRNETELAELPETVGPGSVAFTADLNSVLMMDEDGEWQQMGGETAEETTEETNSGSSGGSGGSSGESGSGSSDESGSGSSGENDGETSGESEP